jgi:hypothetical protein
MSAAQKGFTPTSAGGRIDISPNQHGMILQTLQAGPRFKGVGPRQKVSLPAPIKAAPIPSCKSSTVTSNIARLAVYYAFIRQASRPRGRWECISALVLRGMSNYPPESNLSTIHLIRTR